ncbi:MAG: helix-turn-helix transcriptional regulator [Clostridia bacterium]|nr:helix-turn-helix transcriptional regulator [Clostridia bacterium]
MQIALAEQLKYYRRRDNRTQEDLALALGVTSQAVSRWETGTCYPDMELIPVIANYFGVSIDELFGYHGEREAKINDLVKKITEMNRQNNGVDLCVEECIRLAREGLVEFPGNESLMLCLASVLFNAGYVRHGEKHLTDENGYDTYDVEGNGSCAEWQEAIPLYEKVLETLPVGEKYHRALGELVQLYANTGKLEKADAKIAKAPGIGESRELLRLVAHRNKAGSAYHGKAILELAKTCAEVMVWSVMLNQKYLTDAEAEESIGNAIGVMKSACPDGNFGFYHQNMIWLTMYYSEFLWKVGKKEAAFEALDEALMHARALEKAFSATEVSYTAPLLRNLREPSYHAPEVEIAETLPVDWPWWQSPDYREVKAEMEADPRWKAWVEKTKDTY